MSAMLVDANDPTLESWVESANDSAGDFPIQNLPFGRFRPDPDVGWRIGVAIGDQVLDLSEAGLIDTTEMQRLLGLSAYERRTLRQAISEGLRRGSKRRTVFEAALVSQAEVELGVPCEIRDYTDFYVGIGITARLESPAASIRLFVATSQPLTSATSWFQKLAGRDCRRAWPLDPPKTNSSFPLQVLSGASPLLHGGGIEQNRVRPVVVEGHYLRASKYPDAQVLAQWLRVSEEVGRKRHRNNAANWMRRPAVTAVICGPRTMEQWNADLMALRKPLFTAEDFRTIATESHWRPD